MEHKDLHETFNDTTYDHYIAHNVTHVLPFKKHYYSLLSSIDVSFVEISLLSDDWLVMGITTLPNSRVISPGDKLKVSPENQNNKQSSRVSVSKNTQIRGIINDEDFIDQVYVNVYQKNSILLGLVNARGFYIEVKNTRDADVYYNLNIKIYQAS